MIVQPASNATVIPVSEAELEAAARLAPSATAQKSSIDDASSDSSEDFDEDARLTHESSIHGEHLNFKTINALYCSHYSLF